MYICRVINSHLKLQELLFGRICARKTLLFFRQKIILLSIVQILILISYRVLLITWPFKNVSFLMIRKNIRENTTRHLFSIRRSIYYDEQIICLKVTFLETSRSPSLFLNNPNISHMVKSQKRSYLKKLSSD